MKKTLIILSAIVLLACNHTAKKTTEQTVETEAQEQEIETKTNNSISDAALRTTIDNTVGFITFPPFEGMDTITMIEIYNPDNTLWAKFPYDYTKEIAQYPDFEFPEYGFWAFAPEINVFVIRCVAENDDSYTIIVNETEKTKKFLKKQKYIHFRTLEEHLFDAIIGIEEYAKVNPLRKSPNGDAEKVKLPADFSADYGYRTIEIKGDWIKVEAFETNYIKGWVRWRKGNQFMIDFYYSI